VKIKRVGRGKVRRLEERNRSPRTRRVCAVAGKEVDGSKEVTLYDELVKKK
jgi:hypothetical protein